MRIAALYDIHGNLPALEAVLVEVREAGIDRVVIGGDVLLGPMPAETLACLARLKLPTVYIAGNCERAMLAQDAGAVNASLPDAVRDALRWTSGQLGDDQRRFVAGWPQLHRARIDGIGDVLFCHATPRSDSEIVTRLTPEARVAPAFEGVDAALVVCGHTHAQFDRTIGAVRVVNAGSVGMPADAPGAYWLLLGPDVQLRHTPYDTAAAATRIRSSGYPDAESFAARHVSQPPAGLTA